MWFSSRYLCGPEVSPELRDRYNIIYYLCPIRTSINIMITDVVSVGLRSGFYSIRPPQIPSLGTRLSYVCVPPGTYTAVVLNMFTSHLTKTFLFLLIKNVHVIYLISQLVRNCDHYKTIPESLLRLSSAGKTLHNWLGQNWRPSHSLCCDCRLVVFCDGVCPCNRSSIIKD